jgi:hypothetical protein
MTDFVSLLMESQNGHAATTVNEKLRDLVKAIQETAKGGTLTLKLAIVPGKTGMGGAVLTVVTSIDCVIKKPELAIGDSIFFVTDDGELTRDDPKQAAMFEEKKRVR